MKREKRIDELIAELCPDGVEYKPLGEVCEFIKGKGLSKADRSTGDIPILLYGELYTTYGMYITRIISHSSQDKVGSSPTTCFSDIVIPLSSTTREAQIGKASVVKVQVPVYVGGDALILRHNIEAGYLAYYLNSSWFEVLKMKCINVATISHLLPKKLSQIQIPIPPLSVQKEIVRILDGFTGLIDELEAELAARRKQFEQYREKLLTFGDEVERKPLGEIGRVAMCKRIFHHQTSSSGPIPFYKIGTFGKKPDAYISQELFDEYRSLYSYPTKGAVLLSAAGTIGRTVVFNGEPSYFQDSNIVWLEHDESNVLNKFLYYCYQLQPWRIAVGGTVSRLYNANIEKTSIPIPSLAEQKKIITTLDHFAELIDTIEAEIAARKKQYEYYREKLLTFQRKETA